MTRVKNWVILALISIFSSVLLWLPVGMNSVYENFDGPYYLVVAKTWYNKTLIGQQFSFTLPTEYYAAHLPLYPLLINITQIIPGITGPQAMVGINILFSVLSAITVYEIAKKLKLNNPLFLAFIWLFWWPRMWVVRSVGSPETIFALFIVSSLYFFQKGKYFLAGILGALAVLTKSPGIILFATYALSFIKKPNWKMWPTLLIPAAALGLFAFYQLQTGDFWAYFNSGDNIHLQLMPFKIFDSNQPWVGDFWLEDVLWVYLVGAVGVIAAWRKNQTFGLFGAIFYLSLLFVSHRDISRYSLPLVPVVLFGLSDIFNRKEVRIIFVLLLIPLYFYSLNFLSHNLVAISDWTPFL